MHTSHPTACSCYHRLACNACQQLHAQVDWHTGCLHTTWVALLAWLAHLKHIASMASIVNSRLAFSQESGRVAQLSWPGGELLDVKRVEGARPEVRNMPCMQPCMFAACTHACRGLQTCPCTMLIVIDANQHTLAIDDSHR